MATRGRGDGEEHARLRKIQLAFLFFLPPAAYPLTRTREASCQVSHGDVQWESVIGCDDAFLLESCQCIPKKCANL